MKQLMAEHGGEWPQQDYYDLREWFGPLSLEGHYLTADEWRDWQRGLDILYQCVRFFYKIDSEKYPEIHRITQVFKEKWEGEEHGDFRQILPIIQELDRVFDANGQIITLVQVAGLIARRILCYAHLGDKIKKGERYGFIRFGSRVDVYLPLTAEPLVSVGDKVSATSTVLAKLPGLD
jgi:phosphatidylserine decarboxylase precursor-related protein